MAPSPSASSSGRGADTDEPGRVLDAIVTRRDVRTEFVTTLEQEMRNRSDGLVDVRDRDRDGDDDYYVGVNPPLTDADEALTEDEERRMLDAIHRQMDDLHVLPFDPEAYKAKEAKLSAAESRLRYRAQEEAFWGPSLSGWKSPPNDPPKKWSWAWWCREWRFLTLRLRWWAIKRLGGVE